MRRSSRRALVALLALAALRAVAAPGDEAAIRGSREASNAAIARHDATGATAPLLPDVLVVSSGGTLLRGREAMDAAFRQVFADPGFITYVREPERVEVAGDTAAESGSWRGTWKTRSAGGRFLARWRRTSDGWRIQSELFVPLY